MSEASTESIAPHDWARTGRQLQTSLPLTGMPRLGELLEEPAGEVQISLAGQLLGGRRAVLIGHAAATVTVRCQRCLESMPLRLEVPIRLGVLKDEDDIARLPEGYEPLICPVDQELPLGQLMEDELLLALPDHPHHADGMCSATALPAQQAGKRRPFAALASLRKDDPLRGHDD